MSQYRVQLKKAILLKFGSVEKWAVENGVTPVRFYNFLKGRYNPTIYTLEGWIRSVDLKIFLRKK